MSSVVKKASHFTPKVNKRATKKRDLSTPPATQDKGTQSHTVQDHGQVPITAPSTQTETSKSPTTPTPGSLKSLSKFSISKESAPSLSPDAPKDASLDPISKVPEHAVEASDSDDEEYGDNDIFKQPITSETRNRRRSSVASHRRLSGINPFRRPSSSSLSGTPGAAESDDHHEAPVTIGIPSSKPSKRRRTSSRLRSGSRINRESVVSIPHAKDILQEEREEVGRPNMEKGSELQNRQQKSLSSTDVVVGIDPKTGKLTKYRASKYVIGHKGLPVAPDDLITTISDITQIPRNISKEDESYYANVQVSTDEMSMSDLCKPDIKIGLVSDNFSMAEEARKKNLLKRSIRRKARARARQQRIPYEDALRELQGDVFDAPPVKPLDNDTPEMPEATSSVKLSIVGGRLEVDQDSTYRSRANDALNNGNRKVEIENPFENPVTSSTYSKSSHSDAWTNDELVEFYKALSTWGTDFTFIAQLFPYRTRGQVKRKFTLEEKRNPQLVELALRRKLPLDFEEFRASVSSALTFKSVEDFNKEIANIRKEHETHLREINEERERAIKEDWEANRKREIELRTGAKPRTKAEQARIYRANEVVLGKIEDVKRSRDQMEAGSN